MRGALICLALAIPSACCFVGAAAVAWQGHRGWGWLILVGFLLNPLMNGSATQKIIRAASGMSASGQDPQGLEAKPASPTAKGGDAQ